MLKRLEIPQKVDRFRAQLPQTRILGIGLINSEEISRLEITSSRESDFLNSKLV